MPNLRRPKHKWQFPVAPETDGRCDCGKLSYRSESAAKTARKAVKEQGRGNDWQGTLVPYFCAVSGTWHLGHTETEYFE